MLHRCNCRPLAGDPENYHNIVSNLQHLHNENSMKVNKIIIENYLCVRVKQVTYLQENRAVLS